jgi:hypothetical protein
MSLFKKLQENSLYWRYRFITSRYLRMKRWWRELRRPGPKARVVRSVPRGMASFDPYGSGRRAVSVVNGRRGVAFVVLAAALWTAVGYSALANSTFPVELVQFASLGLLVYVFVRFW